MPRTGRVPSWRCSLSRQLEVTLSSLAAIVGKLHPQGRDVNQPLIGVGGLQASKRFLGVDANVGPNTRFTIGHSIVTVIFGEMILHGRSWM
jgi:hypothetical protein